MTQVWRTKPKSAGHLLPQTSAGKDGDLRVTLGKQSFPNQTPPPRTNPPETRRTVITVPNLESFGEGLEG